MLLFLLRTSANAVTYFPPYFVCTTSEGPGEIAQMGSLVWTYTCRPWASFWFERLQLSHDGLQYLSDNS